MTILRRLCVLLGIINVFLQIPAKSCVSLIAERNGGAQIFILKAPRGPGSPGYPGTLGGVSLGGSPGFPPPFGGPGPLPGFRPPGKVALN